MGGVLWKGNKVLKTGQSNSLALFRLIEETDVKFVVYERFIFAGVCGQGDDRERVRDSSNNWCP